MKHVSNSLGSQSGSYDGRTLSSSESGCSSACEEDTECIIVTSSFCCTSQLSGNDTKQLCLCLCLQVVSQHVKPGTLEGISLNIVDYGAIRYNC